MICKKSVRDHFSKNAFQYHRYARVQHKMAQELWDTVKNDVGDRAHILEIGCGTGYLTQMILQDKPDAIITAVDIAPGMIEYAQKNVIHKGNIIWHCGDIEEMIFTQQYDLIISNATFQWFNTLDKTLKNLEFYLKKNGRIAFSTFGQGTFQELHHAFKQAEVQTGYKASGPIGLQFKDTKELESILEHAGLKANVEHVYEKQYFESVRSFLESIKKIGANNSNHNRKPQSPALMKAMFKCYDNTFRHEERVFATYHCVYCYGLKTTQRSVLYELARA